MFSGGRERVHWERMGKLEIGHVTFRGKTKYDLMQ